MSTAIRGVVHERTIARIVRLPPLTQGFAGPGHLMAPVIAGGDFEHTDPFIMLADDHLDLGERSLGGAHPHAGFETVTLLLDGELYDRDEGGRIRTGEVQWMTAGGGIIHGENVAARGRVRLLQLWLTLPRRDRWTTPDFQNLGEDVIPIRREDGVTVRVYSGESGGYHALTRNHVPTTIIEAVMAPGTHVTQSLPVSYNGFVFPIDGEVTVGDSSIGVGDVGWLDRPATGESSRVTLRSGSGGARLVLYAGEPQGDAIVSHGPFIGDSRDDIVRLYTQFRSGQFPRMSDLARARKGTA